MPTTAQNRMRRSIPMNTDFIDTILQRQSSVDNCGNLRQSVQQNIRFLLESRQSPEGHRTQPAHSLFAYGLSVRHIGRSRYHRNLLCKEIEQLIDQFEPRLYNVSATADAHSSGGMVHIHIEGMLHTGSQSSTPVVFESVFNLGRSQLNFEESHLV